MSDVKAVEALYIGRVQGVGFRMTCASIAKEFGLQGYVMNNQDRSVTVWAQGTERKVDGFLSAIQLSRLGSLIVTSHITPREYDSKINSFEIRYF